jgi:hypothetical protein
MAKPGTVDWMTLPRLAAGTDVALLLMRLVTGAFLIHGVWDNIESAERMDEFVRFLLRFKFAVPELMAQCRFGRSSWPASGSCSAWRRAGQDCCAS